MLQYLDHHGANARQSGAPACCRYDEWARRVLLQNNRHRGRARSKKQCVAAADCSASGAFEARRTCPRAHCRRIVAGRWFAQSDSPRCRCRRADICRIADAGDAAGGQPSMPSMHSGAALPCGLVMAVSQEADQQRKNGAVTNCAVFPCRLVPVNQGVAAGGVATITSASRHPTPGGSLLGAVTTAVPPTGKSVTSISLTPLSVSR